MQQFSTLSPHHSSPHWPALQNSTFLKKLSTLALYHKTIYSCNCSPHWLCITKQYLSAKILPTGSVSQNNTFHQQFSTQAPYQKNNTYLQQFSTLAPYHKTIPSCISFPHLLRITVIHTGYESQNYTFLQQFSRLSPYHKTIPSCSSSPHSLRITVLHTGPHHKTIPS